MSAAGERRFSFPLRFFKPFLYCDFRSDKLWSYNSW